MNGVLNSLKSKKYNISNFSNYDLYINNVKSVNLSDNLGFDVLNLLGNSILPLHYIYFLAQLNDPFYLSIDFEELLFDLLIKHKSNYISLNYQIDLNEEQVRITVCKLKDIERQKNNIVMTENLCICEPRFPEYTIYDVLNGFNKSNLCSFLKFKNIDVWLDTKMSVLKVDEYLKNGKKIIVDVRPQVAIEKYLYSDKLTEIKHPVIITDSVIVNGDVLYFVIDNDKNIKGDNKYIIEEHDLSLYLSSQALVYNVNTF